MDPASLFVILGTVVMVAFTTWVLRTDRSGHRTLALAIAALLIGVGLIVVWASIDCRTGRCWGDYSLRGFIKLAAGVAGVAHLVLWLVFFTLAVRRRGRHPT
jgi:hypothetical protein